MQSKPRQFTLNNREYMLGTAPVGELGHVAVALPLPEKYSDALNQLEQSEQRYQELRRNNKLIRQTYMQALLLITLLVLFGTTWSALALSKLVTRPVTALAEGTQAISAGKLDYRVEVSAGDELGQLVGSFNSMAAELESNRSQLQEANAAAGRAPAAHGDDPGEHSLGSALAGRGRTGDAGERGADPDVPAEGSDASRDRRPDCG